MTNYISWPPLSGIAVIRNRALLPKLFVQIGIVKYIKTKDKEIFMKTMADIRDKYPGSLEAQMYFWEE